MGARKKKPTVDTLDSNGLSSAARRTLSKGVQARVAEAWSRGRALILNANKPNYSEAFTIEAEQYRALRETILTSLDALADSSSSTFLKDIVSAVQAQLGDDPLFPKGRMTNYTRYVKTDLEARGEITRVPRSSPQRVRRPTKQ